MQPIEQWDLFDFVAMRRLQQPNNHQLKFINIHSLKWFFENVQWRDNNYANVR